MIKVVLREWHLNHSHNIPGKISQLIDRIAVLDEKGEVSTLEDKEVADLHGLSRELHSLSRIHSGICWQQALFHWLREGNANSKYFHGTMSSRRHVNSIYVIEIGGVSVEGVSNVRKDVFNHFSDHFKAPNMVRT